MPSRGGYLDKCVCVCARAHARVSCARVASKQGKHFSPTLILRQYLHVKDTLHLKEKEKSGEGAIIMGGTEVDWWGGCRGVGFRRGRG
jgi:hypothetical protein